MGLEFGASEVFEMACQIERNGAKFYRKAAEADRGAGMKQKLLDLAAMEDDHLATFSSMMADLSDQERAEAIYDPDNEAVSYLEAFADGHVFDPAADPSEALTGSESIADVLKTAIGLEKDSITFYIGIRHMVPEKLGKDKVSSIIREEMGHVVLLTREMADL